MKYMKPIASEHFPSGGDWLYEIKYDGFRAQLRWGYGSIELISRNGHHLSSLFPEIITFCNSLQPLVQPFLPLALDGELVVLNHTYQANFERIQQRGRMQQPEKIDSAAQKWPAAFLAFDIVNQQGNTLENNALTERKETLRDVFSALELSINDVDRNRPLSYVPFSTDASKLWKTITTYKAEGMVAKRKTSTYQAAKNHRDWYKVKNWRTIDVFLTFYDVTNGYFTAAVYKNGNEHVVGKCKHGLNAEEEKTLTTLFTTEGTERDNGYALPPAICARIRTLDLYQGAIREPEFAGILPHHHANDVTAKKMQLDLAMFPSTVEVTNTDKIFWPKKELTKGDFLVYIRDIAPFMLPFLSERVLTVIRSPDGVRGEHFFQKHLPEYAPSYIRSVTVEDEKRILCDHLEAFLWLANHGAIEYHTPFEKHDENSPSEIVFDLDPPDATRFQLAVKGALSIKELLDALDLIAFVKTSGNKGMQVHIPLPTEAMFYTETGTLTKAIAETLEKTYPTLFTTERLKRHRNERLYIDYLQHAKGKTIITPYSPRLTEAGTVATPLYWEEVTETLHPEQFTIENVVRRVQTDGCPFATFFETGENQHLEKVRHMMHR